MKRIDLELSDKVYDILAEYCARQGIKSKRSAVMQLFIRALAAEMDDDNLIPDDPMWGGWRGNPNSLKALMDRADKLTDKGRNDPLEAE